MRTLVLSLLLALGVPGLVMGAFAVMASVLVDSLPLGAIARHGLAAAPLLLMLGLESARAVLTFLGPGRVTYNQVWELHMLLFAALALLAARLLGCDLGGRGRVALWTGFWTGCGAAAGSCAGALTSSLLGRA